MSMNDFFGICPIKNKRKVLIQALPLLALPFVNLMCITEYSISPRLLLTAIKVLFWAFAEELFFRGLIPQFLIKRLQFANNSAAIVSSAVFAIFHFANGLSGTPFIAILPQVLLAFGVGLCFSKLAIVSESIVPSTIIHFLLNFSAELGVMRENTQIEIVWTVIALICIGYGMWIFHKEKFKEFAFNEIIH